MIKHRNRCTEYEMYPAVRLNIYVVMLIDYVAVAQGNGVVDEILNLIVLSLIP